VDRDYRKIKSALLNSITNFGNPIIEVVDANYRNRGELYLNHDWVGKDLQLENAEMTLRGIQKLWKRPVHLETREEGSPRLLSFDGETATIQEITASEHAKEVVGSAGE